MMVYGFYRNEIVAMEAEDNGAYVRLQSRHAAFDYNLLMARQNVNFSKRDLLDKVYARTREEVKSYRRIARELNQELKRIQEKYLEVYEDKTL